MAIQHWKSVILALLSLTVCYKAQPQQQVAVLPDEAKGYIDSSQGAFSLPGNSPFRDCTANHTKDILTIDWATLVPNDAHVGHPIQLMVNGTLSKNIHENFKIRVNLSQKGSKYQPLEMKYDFCSPLEEVRQEDGPQCPPIKGGVEITAHSFVWFVSEGDVIETTIEALNPKNETIACLYGEVDVVR